MTSKVQQNSFAGFVHKSNLFKYWNETEQNTQEGDFQLTNVYSYHSNPSVSINACVHLGYDSTSMFTSHDLPETIFKWSLDSNIKYIWVCIVALGINVWIYVVKNFCSGTCSIFTRVKCRNDFYTFVLLLYLKSMNEISQ